MSSLPAPSMSLSDTEFEAIESAVNETARGRWFLAEYARRNRTADTATLMTALDRIEAVVRGERTVEAVDRIRFDLLEMAKAIARTKAEIAAIKPDAEHHGKLGDATEELDLIVETTETATSEILAAAEHIQETAWSLRENGLDAQICDAIDTRATEIYTACSFQDLTGQRTRKVIQVLRYLEGRINAMIDIWGLDNLGAAAPAPQHDQHMSPDRALLNGPARPGDGLDQTDIDMVMGPARTFASAAAAVTSVETAAAAAIVIDTEAVDIATPLDMIDTETHAPRLDPSVGPDEESPDEFETAELPDAEATSLNGTSDASEDPASAATLPDEPAPQTAALVMTAEPEPSRDSKVTGLAALDPIMALSETERLALFS